MNNKLKKKIPFKKGDLVHFSAFLKKDKNIFYLCRGYITEAPNSIKQPFKVKIKGVGSHAIGGKENLNQAALLGRIISKKIDELVKEPNSMMIPPGWIEVVVN